jgi:riboflavin transporter FmnP
VDGRIVGTITATLALIVLGFVALGLYTSLAGVLIAGGIAAVVGVAAGTLAEPAPLRT